MSRWVASHHPQIPKFCCCLGVDMSVCPILRDVGGKTGDRNSHTLRVSPVPGCAWLELSFGNISWTANPSSSIYQLCDLGRLLRRRVGSLSGQGVVEVPPPRLCEALRVEPEKTSPWWGRALPETMNRTLCTTASLGSF